MQDNRGIIGLDLIQIERRARSNEAFHHILDSTQAGVHPIDDFSEARFKCDEHRHYVTFTLFSSGRPWHCRKVFRAARKTGTPR